MMILFYDVLFIHCFFSWESEGITRILDNRGHYQGPHLLTKIKLIKILLLDDPLLNLKGKNV